MSVLAGFPDRVGAAGQATSCCSRQVARRSWEGPLLPTNLWSPLMPEDRKDKPLPLSYDCTHRAGVVIELFPDRVREHSSVGVNRLTERVEAVSALLYDELSFRNREALLHLRRPQPNCWRKKALEAGVERFV